MAFSVVMPALEMAQETGKLLAWRKKEGDHVRKGEPLLEIETDKAVVELEAPADGILGGIKAEAGADIPVGQTIAWIVAPGESVPVGNLSTAPAARAGSHAKTETPQVATAAPSGAAPATPSNPKISPKARRLAKELGGEILAADVQAGANAPAAVETTAAVKKSGSIEVPSSRGRIMAERTTQSW